MRVVGGAENVEPGTAVEIDKLLERQVAVAPGRVSMQLAEQAHPEVSVPARFARVQAVLLIVTSDKPKRFASSRPHEVWAATTFMG